MSSLFWHPPMRLLLSIIVLLAISPTHNQHAQAAVSESAHASEQPPQIFLPLMLTSVDSEQLIEEAQAAGRISAETALIYRVYLAFGDARLPAEYRGSGSENANEIADEVMERFNQLSPNGQALLEPFIMPPYHVGSWWDQQRQSPLHSRVEGTKKRCHAGEDTTIPLLSDWHFVDSPGGKVRVWWQVRYPGDEAQARRYAEDVDAIWNSLAQLMQREPPSDGGKALPCRGGSDQLDISLVDIGVNGQAWPYSDPADTSSSYLLIKRGASRGTLIHELMHSFQFAYDLQGKRSEYRWWGEATATWAVEYVDHGLNHEHGYAGFMQNVPELPLETNDKTHHQYGAYLFPLFLQYATGRPEVVRQSWEEFEDQADSLAALNTVITPAGGDFAAQWPKFALTNWNRDKIDLYRKSDGLASAAKPKLDRNVLMAGVQQRTITLEGPIEHLSASYYHFTFPDDQARSITFYNGFGFKLSKKPFRDDHINDSIVQGEALMWDTIDEDAKRGLHISALVKIGGEWQVEQDWTNAPYQSFCRDTTSERIEELVIIVSNSEWQDREHKIVPQGLDSIVTASNIGCYQWTGRSSNIRGEHTKFQDQHYSTIGEDIVWQREPLEVQHHSSGSSYLSFSSFAPISGKASATISGWSKQLADCTFANGVGIDNVAITPQDGPLVIYTHATPKAGGYGLYLGTASNMTEYPTRYVEAYCPGGTALVGPWFFAGAYMQKAVTADGITIKDLWADSTATNDSHLEWDFKARRQ